MLSQETVLSQQIQFWPIDKFVFYARNPRKNDAAVDRMCSSIREFGFKVPVLARSDGTVVDGHLRLKAARKLGSWPGGDTASIPVILCDEWSDGQVKAFRLLVNRSATWAAFDEELLALELQQLNESDYDLSLTGFDPGEIDGRWPFRTRSEPMPRRHFPRTQYPALATCGSAASIAFFAEMPPAPRTSPGCSASANRS